MIVARHEVPGESVPRKNRPVGDGSFGVALFQALRARLRSACPSGTKAKISFAQARNDQMT
jgi:hypothetical protein